MRVTLRQVAERAGVAPMTVSYVLNGKDHLFRPETVAKVRAAAQELGYRPNASAKGMRSGRIGNIGLVVDSLAGTWNPASMMNGIHDALASRRQHLIYARVAIGDDDPSVPPLLAELNADGLLVNFPPHLCSPRVDSLLAGFLPTVWLNHRQEHNAVHPDDLAIGAELVRMAVEAGHQRVAWLQYWASGGHHSQRDRLDGARAALRAAGRPWCGIVAERDPWLTEWHAAVRELLGRRDRPTCLACYGDFEMHTAYEAILERGLRVPQDVSVLLVTDRQSWQFGRFWSGVELRMAEVGAQAVDMLEALIADPAPQSARAIAPERADGGTTLAAPPT